MKKRQAKKNFKKLVDSLKVGTGVITGNGFNERQTICHGFSIGSIVEINLTPRVDRSYLGCEKNGLHQFVSKSDIILGKKIV